jgi:triosephosphate isomerase
MLIVGNWKAYIENFQKAKKLFVFSKKLASKTGCDIVLAPPTPFLGAFAFKNASRVAFAVQDVSVTSGGAQTGEVTASMSATAGATYAIIGHSERRAMGDTNAIIAKKLAHSLAHNLIPILCIGEHEQDTDGQYLSFIREEITEALTPLTPKERTKVLIAYEPLWAIGKDASEAMSANDLREMVLYIHKVLAELLPGKSSVKSLVLYGGAVAPENIRALATESQVSGFLVGRASTDETIFAQLIQELV